MRRHAGPHDGCRHAARRRRAEAANTARRLCGVTLLGYGSRGARPAQAGAGGRASAAAEARTGMNAASGGRPPGLTPAYVVATMGGIGLVRWFPGTWGSMLVLPAVLLGPLPCLALGLLVAALGWWATWQVLRERPGAADPHWIVIDEGAGQLLALAGLPLDANATGMVMAFALFRALDILKAGPVGWADRQGGAFGVMLDDLIAGAIAAAGLMMFHRYYPGVLN